MARKKVIFQVRLTEPQHSWLVREAVALGIGANEYVRRLIDERRFAERVSEVVER